MRRLLVLAALIAHCFALQTEGIGRPELKEGIISFVDRSGHPQIIDVGKKCGDLWVAPDQSVIAFLAIDRSRGVDDDGNPFIIEDSIYTARKSEDFAPTRVPVTSVSADGRDWHVFRYPKVLAGDEAVSFLVPVAASYGELFLYDFKAEKISDIGVASEYCAVRGGQQPGTILIQRRRLVDSGFEYKCYARAPDARETAVDENCDDFVPLRRNWTLVHGGDCN